MKFRSALFLIGVLAYFPSVGLAAPQRGPGDTAFIDGPPAPVPPAVVSRDESGHVTVRAIPLTQPLEFDGRLDDGLYAENEAITDFIQQEPFEGRPATDRTEVWVAFDDDSLYIGARLWESDSARRVMSDMRRDANNLYNNDHFGVYLDTFYDRRNGYLFYANAQGGMSDAEVTNESALADWNTIWDVKSADFDGGWTIEFRIPFHSIRFKEGSSIWGINFRRNVRWKTEMTYLTPTPASYQRNGLNRGTNAATLVGIDAPRNLRNITLKGYALGSSVTNRAARPIISNKGNVEFGGDARWGVSQSYVADFTVNTDFAQVEDDEQVVNLTRFTVRFPEKREFFLESNQLFSFGMQQAASANPEVPTVFFSRRIGIEGGTVVPILGGGRLLGRSGRYRVGAIAIRTGEERSVGAVATDFTAVRVQREILRRSRIGLISTTRNPASGAAHNYVYGADAILNFYENVGFINMIARSVTPGRHGDDLAYRSRFSWNPDRWTVDVEQIGSGRNFNPEMGYVQRPDGYRRSHARFAFEPRPKNLPGVRKVSYTLDLDYFTDASGRHLETRDQLAFVRVDFSRGDNWQIDMLRTRESIDETFLVAKNVRVPVGDYVFRQMRTSYTFGPQRKLSGTATLRYGGFYEGTLRELSWRSRIEFSPQLYAEPTISWNRIDLPWARGNENLAITRVTYTLSPRMFVSGLVQYQSRNDAVSTNARFRWEYTPGSELFVVYSDGRTTLTRGIPDIQNRSFVVKVTRFLQM